MPPRKGKRRVDSKEWEESSKQSHEETHEKPPTGRQGVQSESKGACGTSADEKSDGNPKNNRSYRKGQWTRKQREGKQGGSKPPFRDREEAGQDTTANRRRARKKTGAGNQLSPSQGGQGTSDVNFNKHKKQPQRGRGRGASSERQVGSSNGRGKPSDKNQEQRPGRPYPKHKTHHPARPVFHGKCISLDLKTLKQMDTTELVDTLNESMPRLKFFLRSPEEEHNSDEFIFDLTCTLAIACNAPPSEGTNKILAALKGSLFLSEKIPRLLDRVQGSTALTDADSQRCLIEWLIKVFKRYLRHLPSSYADLPYDQLKRALDQLNIDRKDEVRKELEAFKQARDDIIRAERQKHGKRYINKAGQKPPNDFRDMPVCPTNKEITTQERPYLRKNILKGRYEDAEHYLDVQFRLLREDFLEPLREGIPEIVNNVPRRQRNQLMKNYPGARIVGKKFTPSGIIYEVQFDVSRFDTRKWAHSKRLIFGSFLCLSKDNFETILFATVANRDPDELKIGKIDIRFIEEQDVFGIENRKCEYLMVESPAYYEAYRHVLKGLKELDETTMPFKKYLVECSEDVDPPEYLRREDSEEPVCYDLSLALDVPDSMEASSVPVLQPEAWPSVETLPLNNSQLEALKTAVTTEFSVIQGPPGTGKTYVGAKIVRCLLENREAWDPDEISPMLMVCYTNHALDQFLEKVLEFLPREQIIRVGGRCKSPKLESCNLKLFTREFRMHERRKEISDMINNKVWETREWKELLSKADAVLLEFDDLEELLNSEHAEQLYSAIFPPNAETECRTPGNTFKLWLCNNKQMDSFNRRSAKAKKEDLAGDRQGGSISPGSREGEDDDEVFYDVASLAAPHEGNEGKGNNSLAHTNESREVTHAETPSPKDASNVATKRLYLSQEDLIETPVDSTVPRDLPRQQRSKLESSQINSCVEDATVSKSLEELDDVEDVKQMSESDNVKENSYEDMEAAGEAFEETITIEKEADLIENQRCIHGDEDFLPVMSKRSDDLASKKQDGEEPLNDQEEGWQTVTYRKKGKTFPWQQKTNENTKDRKESTQVETNQESTAQTKSSKKNKKKNKRKNRKIKIIADIKSLKPELEKETTMTADEAMSVDNIWLLSPSDRLRLYLFWVESYRERYRTEIQRGEQEYEELCHRLETVRFEEEQEVIRRATVVGMTTSGAARYHSVLQRVAPKVVVIEEAAEVMEAHIITSLAKDTKHTILIGDHKQLRPKATVYELAQKYNLAISLFERMVMNSMDCKRLCIQHRMRPEIAALTKRIYDHEIVDHESVCEFGDIAGMAHNLFFIDHSKPEIMVGGLQSYSNPHEADFLVAFCSYLLLQGYSRSQITILTMYTGQLLLLQEKMPKRLFGGVRVCAVDNFQGEENDIILLSLVRSNSEHRIGFLSESNRICVALSRARQGFYCIGNFSLLKSQCKLWKEICDYLQTKNAIGEILQLVCKKHKNVTNVRCSGDFDKSGGCKKPCGDRLNCGHACDRLCHVSDSVHKDEQCSKICFISCPNEHQCQLRCHYPSKCPKCYQLVLKTIPRCGHEQRVQCSTDPANFLCRVKCEKTLPCGHLCQDLCGNVCTQRCMVECRKTLPCEHEKCMPCFKDPKVYSQCDRNCTKDLDCGHTCSKRCSEPCQCNTKIEVELKCGHRKWAFCRIKNSLLCTERCERVLDCGHVCPGICYEDCREQKCESTVYKILPCGHQQTVPCYLDPQDAVCYAPCQKQLDCGHQCSSVCGRLCHETHCRELCQKKCERGHACQRRCHFGFSCGECMVAITMTIPTCGHSIEMPCHVDPTAPRCKRPCERVRDCGHLCQDKCSNNCEAQPCKEPVARTLPCDHVTTLACHVNPETYKCNKRIEVRLSCGHEKSLVCHVEKAGRENVKCNEMVERELRCKHVVTLPCHKNPEEYYCNKIAKVKLGCGHTKSLICSTVTEDLQGVSCLVKMKRKLPCEHEVTLPCYRNPEEYCCKKEVEVILPCEHNKIVTCSRAQGGLQGETCDTKVTTKLSCGHEKEMKCSDQPEEEFCDAPCERLLPCQHPCPEKCGTDCASLKCAVTVKQKLACGYHEVTCVCSDDVSQNICENKCKWNLSCGHKCPGKCYEDCSWYKCRKMVFKYLDCAGKHSFKMACSDDPGTVTCQELCDRNLDCGHPCPGLCSQDCGRMKCMRRVEKRFPCGHTEPLHCFQRSAATCTAPCRRRKSSCKHICKGVCGQDCSIYPCEVAVGKTLLCGHKIKMPCSFSVDDVQCPMECETQLPCGHQCSGTCDDCHQRGSHELCQHPCGRLLVCSHRCKAICSEPCPPCDRQCGRRCPHGKCQESCSQSCKPCKQPCNWSCPHYQCNNLCGEECDRPRCNAPCPKNLPCRHPCIGLCGENCPTLCAVCHPKKLSSMLADRRGTQAEPTKYLQLFDCGHIIRVQDMDAWMLRELGSDVQLMICPRCSTPITFSYRYGNLVKRTLANIEDVKKRIKELVNEAAYSVSGKSGNQYLEMNKFPRDLVNMIKTYGAWRPNSLHLLHVRKIPLIFTLKNHLLIMQQVVEAYRLLQNVTSDQAVTQQQQEMKEYSSTCKEALNNIGEYLEKPQLDLKTLNQVREHARKIFLFSLILEAQSQAIKHHTSFSSIGESRLQLVRSGFDSFLQGDNEALKLDWLERIVSLLRKEVTLPILSPEEPKDLENFPGFNRGVWKCCGQRHVYCMRFIVRDGEDVTVGSEGCSQCAAMDEYDEEM
ncbi:uncharacterized protein LOC144651634 isoform X2 [Oculina patagonica]